jgi:dynein heavy chain
MMNENNLKSNALEFLLQEDILLDLQNSVSMLEKIHKGLNEYLEKKRIYFPRFYFMSNDELLEILSETKDPLKVEPYLKNCFEGIKKLVYENDQIISMQSAELENVKFLKKINPRNAQGLVEKWLKQVEEVMRLSLETETIKSYDTFKTTELEEWIKLFPGQIVLIVNSIIWTLEVTNVNLKSISCVFLCIMLIFSTIK